jgi:hypothetical protein
METEYASQYLLIHSLPRLQTVQKILASVQISMLKEGLIDAGVAQRQSS